MSEIIGTRTYGGQDKSQLTYPPPPPRGEPMDKFRSPPLHTFTQRRVPLAKFSAHLISQGDGVRHLEESVASNPPPPRFKRIALEGDPCKIFQGTGDTYLSGGEPLAKFSPHPPPPRGGIL